MSYFRRETDGWGIGFERTRTRACDCAHGRDYDRYHSREHGRYAPPCTTLVHGGGRPAWFPQDGCGRHWAEYDRVEDIYYEPNHETAPVNRSGWLRSGAVIPAPKPAPDSSRFEITIRDRTDNRLPAWPEATAWKASLPKDIPIPTIIKHITTNPGKFMVTVVWRNEVEEELHAAIKVTDIEKDAVELRVRDRVSDGPRLPVRRINAT